MTRTANKATRAMALKAIMDYEGDASLNATLERYVVESVMPGACMSCLSVMDAEPDADDNWCPNCTDHGPVKSLFVLIAF